MLSRRSHPKRALSTLTALYVAVLATFGAVFFGTIGVATAQEDPLRLVFLNSDPMDGEGVYDAFDEVLDASGDIDLVEPTELLAAGDAFGVDLETFRDGDRRVQNAEAFEEMLAEASAEAILVLDVFGGGRTVQLVVIGPRGDELDDVRQKIAASRPSRGERIDALKKVFRVLVPEVRSFRKEEAAQQVRVDLIGQGDEESVESIKERVVREHRRNHADLERGVTTTVGAIFGRRSLLLDTDADYHLDHATPFVGLSAEVDAVFALMDADTAAFGATFYAAYAPFTTAFTDPDTGESSDYASAFSNLRLDLKYSKGMGPDLVVHGKAGAELMGVSIDQNEAYTGNSYTNLRVGAGLIYQFGELAELHLDAAALPTLSAKLSDDAMGEADFGWGFNGAGRLHLTFLKPVEASVGYDLHYYAVDYAAPNLEDLRGRPASTTDMVHVGNVMVGYGF